ncbi:MAG: DNA-processing protein DprA [candidate division Zixibacteria bacterium]|nr:DNA-processing protein DprA [candidate division Zixibacteria bacterium]MDH3936662.1 DNA-processing protein DprA [candidate division Zixibacteria bacterium]MDH4032192.1 DNA-processing protein DprA [candidate division Zixibacteria bacterium]
MNAGTIVLKLMQTEGIGARTILRILRAAVEVRCDLEDLLKSEESDLFERFRIPDDLVKRLGPDTAEATNLLEELCEHDVRLVMYATDDYPMQLAQTLEDAAPPALFVYGNMELLKQPTLAVCGSRDVSSEGHEKTSQLVGYVAGLDINVISGAAAGVDQVAHNAAFMAGGVTTIVLPAGILSLNMTDLLDDAVQHDKLLVVSEFYPRAKWTTWGAMQRNSTIIALSQAVLAVEPGLSGGTFEAARTALKLGRPLYLLKSGRDERVTDGHRYFLRKGATEIRMQDKGLVDAEQLIETIRRRHR